MVEHVVMFNIHDDDYPVKVNAMMAGLNSLSSLAAVRHLSAGPILRVRVMPDPLRFTHLLHARYTSLSDLGSYAAHPDHLRVVSDLGRPITDDLIALDWAHDSGPTAIHPGRAQRFTFLKLTDGAGENVKAEILGGLGRIKEKCGGFFEEMTFGEEVSVDRAKGFTVAAAAVFRDLNELDACEEYEDAWRSLVEKYKAAIDGVIAVDYVAPRPGPPPSDGGF